MINSLHTTVTHLAKIFKHKAWQAGVSLSSVGNLCWDIWDSQMPSGHILVLHAVASCSHMHSHTDLSFPNSLHISNIFKFLSLIYAHHLFILFLQPFPLVSSSRWMVKRGELTAFVEDSGIFLKRTSRQQVYFFLFNDVLIVTKKKRLVCSTRTGPLVCASQLRVWIIWCDSGVGLQALLIFNLCWHVERESVTINLKLSVHVTMSLGAGSVI